MPGTLRHAASVRPNPVPIPNTIETAVSDESAARTKSIGTKVSEEEFAALDATARAADMTLSEWVRAVLLAAPDVELPGDEAALAGRVALAELLALRTLLLNLFFRAAKGEAIPEPEMRALIERADGAKMQRARERLETARKESEKVESVAGEKQP